MPALALLPPVTTITTTFGSAPPLLLARQHHQLHAMIPINNAPPPHAASAITRIEGVAAPSLDGVAPPGPDDGWAGLPAGYAVPCDVDADAVVTTSFRLVAHDTPLLPMRLQYADIMAWNRSWKAELPSDVTAARRACTVASRVLAVVVLTGWLPYDGLGVAPAAGDGADETALYASVRVTLAETLPVNRRRPLG